jgi:ABC-type lipoprotein release transport system permease subunit
MASSADGTVGSELFRVAGIFESPNSSFDRMNVYVPIEASRKMLGVGRHIAEIALLVEEPRSADSIRNQIRAKLDGAYEVRSYNDLLPALATMMQVTEKVLGIFYFIIGLAMIFGIINTMLMSVFERFHEFGVIKSIGMRNGSVFRLIQLEALWISLVGIAVGETIGIAVTGILASTGINFAVFSEGLAAYGAGAVIYPVLDAIGILTGTLVIFLVCIFASAYPAWRAARLIPIQALRHV